MITRPGDLYRVELRLFNAEHVDPTWLIGALAYSFPRAEPVNILHYGQAAAVVDMQWRAPGDIVVDQDVTMPLEGLVSGMSPPRARVMSVVRLRAGDVDATVDTAKNLLLSTLILGTTVYLVSRIPSAK